VSLSPRRISLVTLLASVALAAGACAASQTGSPAAAPRASRADGNAVYPDSAWARIADPASVGWSRDGLAAVEARLSTMATTGFMAVVGGRVLFQYGNVDTISYLASVRKSLLSMLYGIHQARGTIDLSRTLAQMGMDDHLGLTATEMQATTRDLIMARSGVYHPASNDGDDLASAPPRGSQPHGTYYLYSNWDFNAAGAAFEKQTGLDIYDAFEQDLAKPLGMRDFVRANHRKSGNLQKSRYPAYHFNLSTRDMARVGYLMLRGGQWNGRQIVPAAWVRESSRALTPVGEMNPARRRSGPWGYGYLWWVWDGKDATGAFAGAYSGLGAVGQHITVMPALDLVIAHKTAPRPGKSVSHEQYVDVLKLLVAAAPTR